MTTTIAYNVYSFDGYVHPPGSERGAVAGQDPVTWAREIGKALQSYTPDIVTTSESRSEDCVAALAETLGFQAAYFPSRGHWPGAVLSRCPIIESANLAGTDPPTDLFTRHWGRTLIELPSGPPLALHSLHTMAGDPAVRLREVQYLLPHLLADRESGHRVIIQGDFNHTPDSPETELWQSAGLVDLFTVAAPEDHEEKTLLRPQPRARLDYVMAFPPLSDAAALSRPLYEARFRLYADRPEAVSLSDHLPILAQFSI